MIIVGFALVKPRTCSRRLTITVNGSVDFRRGSELYHFLSVRFKLLTCLLDRIGLGSWFHRLQAYVILNYVHDRLCSEEEVVTHSDSLHHRMSLDPSVLTSLSIAHVFQSLQNRYVPDAAYL